ncbi:hypothetical protein ACHHYP_03519 [Achlya hypogyna]|uniref:WW domain-containing protein n=1 Tax=Achlya hypogyna TaxID=1202772 RepID=A0A1V9Z3G3_ACHHY|nr:hypothetical protein ACHHYP_03519 [Achlya hypogyna]
MGRTWGTWSEHDAGDGWKYYYDAETKESMWEMPIEVREELGEMEDMMKTALAFSGEWGAFDAGFGTVYYFHLPSRTSVWERPDAWGAEPEMSYAQLAILQEKERAAELAAATASRVKNRSAPKKPRATTTAVVAEEDAPPEETEEEKQETMRRIEAFRAMLREKGILPTFKWEGALPRIAVDDRFRAIPSMDERRAIFEHFIKNRKAEIAAEMKANMKKARKTWAKFVEKALAAMPLAKMSKKKPSLQQFTSYLETQPGYEEVADSVLHILPVTMQESVYLKQLDAWYPQAMRRRIEYKRLLDLWTDHKQKVMDADEYTDPVIAKLRTQVDIDVLTVVDEEEIFATCQEDFRKADDERKSRDAQAKAQDANRREREHNALLKEAARHQTERDARPPQ